MPVVTGQQDQEVSLDGVCTVEEAETLFSWTQEHPDAAINLAGCDHVHTAVLQVLMAVRPKISAGPTNPAVRDWLMPIIGTD